MSGKVYTGFAVALLAVLLLASAAMAQQQGRWSDEARPGAAWSQLDEEQQQELWEQRKAYQEKVYPVRQMKKARNAELNAELASQDPDQGRIEELKSELIQLNQELFETRLEHRIEHRQEYGACPGMRGELRSQGPRDRGDRGQGARGQGGQGRGW
ncbi:zinc resistance protein [Desulfonatronospira thiodismutans ASO3-1]|uniref:Zinc resistance protein n=1 Tax=Desulfonatronospira thiodismutans ASO3-1 TaxID=555779 RepID=D6SJS6_9BACT|nr:MULTISPECIES: periplasmic heavy metal sensor [Desulfonatronospira]EFI36129.1 zinc resistance protein [Desulfonatronospira thiodismutans ASO3-1]RQD78093.1 MAG: periplasmic heavy metal sensor [Desulfonatronospira sp. MSAO_Bac3]